ncbi:MAG: hypothetical protein JRH10_16805 [Deltaproteobacteria bacterium]|nr:hypothetical protein [Deltaproteobacteria bacterium]MBW2444631.1 hypothetical protein [Deltaproteobacteria bacterium]
MSRGWLLAGVVLLYVISIPWYRSPDSSVEIWFGLPDWVAVALGCYVGAAILNALAWMRTDVPEAESAPDVGSDEGVS